MPREVNILISEDEKLNFILLKALLQKILPYKVNIIHASNGKQAVDICSEVIDLILMDLEMPVMNGFDASIAIMQEYPNIPIIIQTAHCSNEHRNKAMSIGCSAFVSKPIIIEDFEILLLKLLGVTQD